MKKLVFMFVAVAAVDSDSIATVDTAEVDTVAADSTAADSTAAE